LTGPLPRQGRGASANQADYSQSFIRQVHELLLMGYGRLAPADHTHEEEPAISGRLVEAINAILDSPTCPRPFHLLSVHDDPPVSGDGRKGKRRRRVDIRIESLRPRPRARFSFEAKRLGPDHPVCLYVGEEGLGCFVNGIYAREAPVAGMLGYVQSGTPPEWAKRIENAMARRQPNVRVVQGQEWVPVTVAPGLDDTYVTGHDRPSVGRPIHIYHTLLVFN